MNKRTSPSPHGQAGFSLVEIMIAVVISMLAIVMVMQIFSTSEARKRITTGGNDAMTGGVLALANLQRDIRQAGYGMTAVSPSPSLLGCTLDLSQTNGGGTLTGLAPVTINHGSIPNGDPNTDTLLVMYSVSNGMPEGDPIGSQPGGMNSFNMGNSTVFQQDDWVIAQRDPTPSPLGSCTLRLDQVTNAAANSSIVTLQHGTNGMAGGRLYNLGHDGADRTRGPQFLAYRVHNSNLTVCDFMQKDCTQASLANDDTVWVPIASNIVSLRAQYGRDTTTPIDGAVDVFDQVTPNSTTPKVFQCQVYRVAAVRLALVARSPDYDKTTPTGPAAPVWEGSTAGNPTAASTAAPFNLSNPLPALPTGITWRNYRYKVFQTIVPIRPVAGNIANLGTPAC